MSFRIIATDHTGITVSNLERSLEFWRDVLGFEFSHKAHQKGERPEQITGVKGAEQAFIIGLIFGLIFAATGQIFTLMIAHAAFDLTALWMIYYDLETRVAHLIFSFP